MTQSRFSPILVLTTLLLTAALLLACAPEAAAPTIGPGPNLPPPLLPTGGPGSQVGPTGGANPLIQGPATTMTPPVAAQNYCPGGGGIAVKPDDKLAARVNGQGIPLVLYQRQSSQAQAAFVAQGVDPNSKQGQENLQALQQQVLEQLISDVLIEQAARSQGAKVTENDVNSRIQALVNDASSLDKFNDYLKANQLLLSDLCTQIRAQLFGEIMIDKVAANVPAKVEQVHAAHILFTSTQDYQKVAPLLKQGQDFAALAKQYSQDAASKDNGGDLGWFPRGVMDPQFEAIAFQLKPGQVSDLITTQFGYHVIKILEKDPARALPPELLQSQRQQIFLAWLDQQRKGAKIEKLIAP